MIKRTTRAITIIKATGFILINKNIKNHCFLMFKKSWLLVFGLIIVVVFYLRITTSHPRIPSISFDNDILQQISTGDLLFLSGDTTGERICKWFSGCCFSHVGLLIKEYNNYGYNIYVLESDLGQSTKSGVRIISLHDKLTRYKGQRIGMIKKIYPTLCYDDIMNVVPKYIDKEFDDTFLSWVCADTFMYPLVKNWNQVFCSELVSMIYMDIGVIKRSNPSKYSPADYMFARTSCNPPYFFGPNVYFSFKDSTKKNDI
jgi:hypothetical protein